MKVKELNIENNEECRQWENFVLSKGYLYQSIHWSKILKDSYSFTPLYLYLEKNSKIISVLPTFHVKCLPFINELVSIPHVEAGGFIEPAFHNFFLDYIRKNLKVNNLRIYQFKEKISDFPCNEKNSLFMITIPETEAELVKYLKKGFKRSVKNLIEKSGIEVVKGNSEEFIKILYQFNVLKNKEFGTPHHSYKFIKTLVENFKDKAVIFIAKKGATIIGVSFIIFYGYIGYHIYHFIPEKYLKIKTGLILYYYIIKESFDRGMKKFSFGRSPKGSGVYKFKTQMHATPYPLYIYNFLIKNNKIEVEKIKILSEKYSWGAEIWSKLPTPLTNFLSPKLRKWIY